MSKFINHLTPCVLGAALACSQAPSEIQPEPEKEQPKPTKSPAELAFERAEEETSAYEAFLVLRPLMDETFATHSTGTLLFASWAADHMSWEDAFVQKDETSFGLVSKDVDAERGKRMCWSGIIVEIHKQEGMKERKFFDGLLATRRRDLISFVAVGSTGDLVQGRWARFCGVVTGRFSYSNSGGGTGHAVDMVGMFKLPENISET